MYCNEAELLALAEQVRQGDAAAAVRLRRRLEPRVVAIVGRALNAPSAALPLTRWIRAQAQKVVLPAGRRPGDERVWLIATLTLRVCDCVLDGLRAGSCSTRLLQETICA